ncbi:uncharacterized protein C5L36_0B05280 [Pichia kudriavzevii]|uniref:Probable endonuclease LCL3 n=1 Tax=Pichia kudriavzevii TaxID=4909 RepID=A0A2U9R1Z5_PICKU|nr:uncharacterized protein C5L36_0B05280 [Pichia kudriavzevii]AWU75281.1 hypothetical protein C5L36_0B05280 [Pichia kudriavzevii]
MERHNTLIPVVASLAVGAVAALSLHRVYVCHLKQISRASDIPPSSMRKRWLYGHVTSVGDGDNFHLYHLPGGLRAGWGWLREVPLKHSQVRGQTISVRLCGIDAPERAHFGKPKQPYSEEALIWLRKYILHRYVYVKPLRLDQYGRVVGRVMVWTWLGWRDVGEEMLKCGLATLYEAQSGVEFDGRERIYRKREQNARRKKLGLWKDFGKKIFETPREYKTKYSSGK